VVAYSTQDAQRPLGSVAETTAERAERQAPGQQEAAQRQAQQARRSERGRGGVKLGG